MSGFLVVRDVAGMVEKDFLAQAGAVDVGVDFGGGDALVTKHRLDGTQVGTTLEEVGGETVAKGVWGDILGYACQLGELLDAHEESDAAELGAASHGNEDVVLVTLLDGELTALLKPAVYLVDGTLRDGDEALLVALAVNTDKAVVEVEVADEQVA